MKHHHCNHYLLYYQEQQHKINRQVQQQKNNFSFHRMIIIQPLLNENLLVAVLCTKCDVSFFFCSFEFSLFFSLSQLIIILWRFHPCVLFFFSFCFAPFHKTTNAVYQLFKIVTCYIKRQTFLFLLLTYINTDTTGFMW